ncbi:MAG: cytochrome c biogenesis protein ResB [Rhodoferax sp.]|nr:cytochrome c biogenesis protein ResB [Rhodoferax sp.]
MSESIPGTLTDRGAGALRRAVELLSSMRFAIALLTLICVASVIGTVLKQHEPLNNYVNQFGPFWAEVFAAFSLYEIYSAWWFLLILAFLVTSTSLCIARNAPKIMADLRTYKEGIRIQSLQSFGHRAQGEVAGEPVQAASRLAAQLQQSGWRVRLSQRATEGGWLVAARAGAANKLGYLAAHSAIVLVCIGGLLDGDLMVRAQMLLGGKSVFAGGGMIADVPPRHRLGAANPTFRGNLFVAEGTRSSTAVLNQSDGVVIQDLPFAVELKKFHVEYYSTGMPKLFASDIVIHDLADGRQVPARVEVNRPASYRGVDIYQSSFDDGGSRVRLGAVPMKPGGAPFEVEGVIGGSTELASTDARLTLEFTSLRLINVENFASGASGASGRATDVRAVDLRQAIESRLGAANRTVTRKELRNVGPSIGYKLRDAAGQAREYHNYMQPVDLGDGVPVFLWGLRDSPAEAFRYLRIPADEQGSIAGFEALRSALSDAGLRQRAVDHYVAQAVDPARPDLKQPLAASAQRALALFAGALPGKDGVALGGLQAIGDFLDTQVPQGERERASEVLVRVLNGSLFELLQLSRQGRGLAPLPTDEVTRSFMTQAVLALSDVQVYPAPVALQLLDYTPLQASVFQVARAPGRWLVYLGCALLILGIFAMLYIRERRIWVWLTPAPGGSQAMMALSTNRKTLDGDREFERLADQLLNRETR